MPSATWGTGDRLVLLVHGMLGAATQYHQVGPALADRGYRVIAVDLPGHGLAAPAPDATMEVFVDAVLDAVDVPPALAIGHSLGAIVLAHALPHLEPERVVYVDVPLDGLRAGPPPSVEELRERFRTARVARTQDRLRATRPEWSAEDCRVEAEAAARFDLETAVSLERSYGGGVAGPPTVPSLVIRADPSRYVSPERALELEKLGFCVRAMPGAGHCVWYGRLDEFLGVLDGWL
ncbi:alpha/beta fold hydrolase [Kribbella shirazensis]|uniref:Pimeloyl-ACP methyl ester carboxylesterase n=1 Tax=Kribbella shirazensis TaxID=1105143 RepID=A0A7X5VE85_9ACTN|nr:alpha/beta fold hydrolase [Kribbella shirazensis]NIK59625.1 pimeloyl-ACP methyl ester carboxylesterase [Kribbella shirazensis]